MQGALITPIGMFDQVDLRTNTRKTVRMVCCPCQASSTQSEAEYKRQMMGARLSYQEIQQVRVQCSKCREEMVMGSLEVHLKTHHGKAMGGI